MNKYWIEYCKKYEPPPKKRRKRVNIKEMMKDQSNLSGEKEKAFQSKLNLLRKALRQLRLPDIYSMSDQDLLRLDRELPKLLYFDCTCEQRNKSYWTDYELTYRKIHPVMKNVDGLMDVARKMSREYPYHNVGRKVINDYNSYVKAREKYLALQAKLNRTDANGRWFRKVEVE